MANDYIFVLNGASSFTTYNMHNTHVIHVITIATRQYPLAGVALANKAIYPHMPLFTNVIVIHGF